MEQNGLKMYRFPDTKGWKIAFCIYFFAMLLVARDTMIAGAILTIEVAQFVSLGLMVLGGIVFLIVNREHLKEILLDQRMIMVVVSTVVILFPMLVKRDWQLMYFSVLMCLYFAVFLTFYASSEQLGKVYIIIISLLSVYSLLCLYILKPLVLSETITVSQFTNSADHSFYNFGLAYAPTWWWYYRNYGIFREPGVYQFFIIIALYMNMYMIKWSRTWISWFYSILLSITMITTYSTNGVVELLLIWSVLFFDKKLYEIPWIKIIALMGTLFLVSITVYSLMEQTLLYVFFDRVFSKLFSHTISMSARVKAIIVDLYLFLNKPFLGDKLATVLHSVDHNTTSTMIMFAIWGIVGGFFHVAGWIALVWEKNRKIWINLVLLLVLFMSFNTQNLIADVFFWMFPMMALIERGLPLLKLERFRKKA